MLSGRMHNAGKYIFVSLSTFRWVIEFENLTVVLLNRSWCTIFVEDTFRDSREHVDHWIDAVILRQVWVVKYAGRAKTLDEERVWRTNFLPPTVISKLPIEELIHQNHLHDDVDQTESLTDPVTNCVHFMALKWVNHFQLRSIDKWLREETSVNYLQMFQHVVDQDLLLHTLLLLSTDA